ncbi:hypothetical protein D3C85_1744550 [compost metagenome]
MAFQKKARINTKDTRPQSSKLEQREAKVLSLKAENNPEARKALKKMNDKVYRGSRSNLKDWYKPTGKGATAKP